MCGRYSLFTPPGDLSDRFDVDVAGYEPTYNAAPGQALPVVSAVAADELTDMEWGLVPSWAEDASDHGHINARAETVADRPAFGEAYERRRCLVPADGFYEWTETAGGKRPYRVAMADDRPFAMAGIYERWTPPTEQAGLGDFGGTGPDVEPRETFAILTTESNDLVADLHDRMAVVLSPEDEEAWLSGADVDGLSDPYPAAEMRAYPVSTAVNDPSNDAPELVDPVDG